LGRSYPLSVDAAPRRTRRDGPAAAVLALSRSRAGAQLPHQLSAIGGKGPCNTSHAVSRRCRVTPHLALPHPNHTPSRGDDCSGIARIPGPVDRHLLCPAHRIGAPEDRRAVLRAAMPETAVHEHGNPPARQNEVRSAVPNPLLKAEPEAEGMNSLPELDLRPCVSADPPAQLCAAGRLNPYARHDTSISSSFSAMDDLTARDVRYAASRANWGLTPVACCDGTVAGRCSQK
jgi:hypothetical protein